MKRLLTAVVLSLTGCATPGYWFHEHGNAAQFERDRLQCEYEATAARPGDPFGAIALGRQCLVARGYKWQTGPMPTAGQ